MDRMYEGELTDSKLLYEGNLEEWLKSMATTLRHQGFSGLEYAVLHSVLKDGPPANGIHDALQEISQCVRWHVSPGLIVRIPQSRLNPPHDFLLSLGGLARPFRFTNLPLELRCNVIKLSLRDRTPSNEIYIHLYRARFDSQTRWPTLARVNREFHHEIIKQTILSTNYILIPAQVYRPSGQATHKHLSGHEFELNSSAKLDNLNTWASSLGSQNLQWLRRISLRMPNRAVQLAAQYLGLGSWSPDTMLRLRYAGETGVSVDENQFLTPESNQMLQRHVKAVEESAKSLNLEGGILVLVLTADPTIWGKLELAV